MTDEAELKQMEPAELVFALDHTAAELDPTGALQATLARAASAAATLHRGQTRANRAGLPRTPYIEHPLRNTIRLMRWNVRKADVLTASLLHDVPEDCADRVVALHSPGDVSASPTERAHTWIREEFGTEVGRIVAAVTNPPKHPGATETARHEQYREHLRSVIAGDASVLLVKLSDFADNAGSLHHNVGHVQDGFIASRVRKYSPLVATFRDELRSAVARGDLDESTAGPAAGMLERTEARFETLSAGEDTPAPTDDAAARLGAIRATIQRPASTPNTPSTTSPVGPSPGQRLAE